MANKIKNQDTDLESGSGMNILDYISESLETFFWVKIIKFFDAHPDPEIFLTMDMGSGMEKFGSGINIPDPQHWFQWYLHVVFLMLSNSRILNSREFL